jgi:hypothetical protein
MSRTKLVMGGAVAVAVGLLFFSCADPPTTQIRRVRTSLSDLRDVSRAERWAPEHLQAAEAAVRAAEKELALQNARFAFMRDFEKTTELFAGALKDIDSARRAADAGRAAAEKDAREALEAATSAIANARAAMMIIPVSRDDRSNQARLDDELGRAEGRLEDVRNLIVAEDYKQAVVRAEEILERISSLLRAVSRDARR